MSHYNVKHRSGVTLVELLVICAILGVLMGMVLFALQGATEQARADRTRAQIARIHEMMMARYEGYRERPLPTRLTTASPGAAAKHRLYCMWELMRMEIPERKSDLVDDAVYLKAPDGTTALRPALWQAMRRKADALQKAKSPPGDWTKNTDADWTYTHQQSECLYLWLSTIRDGETNGLDFFTPSEIGDTDGDGMPEILDGWRTPIRFLRWAPGVNSKLQTQDGNVQPDPFDPLKVGPPGSYALIPFIFSAGPDRKFDLVLDVQVPAPISYASQTTPANNPYWKFNSNTTLVGQPLDDDNDGFDNTDNITNHLVVVR